MGQRIIVGKEVGSDREVALLFDSVTGWAFGPVVGESDDGVSGEDRLGAFIDHMEDTHGDGDMRGMTSIELERAWGAWVTTHTPA